MIYINVRYDGLNAFASCKPGPETITKTSTTTAKALKALIAELSRQHAGEAYEVDGYPMLKGTVPARVVGGKFGRQERLI